MPYISPGNRMALNVIIEGLVKRLRDIECRPGDCNYVVTRVVLEALKPASGWNDHALSDAVRVLKDAATEIERRLLGPYKDTDITKNGDLECFNEPYSLKPTITTHEEVIEKQNLERIREINARRRQEELNKVVWAAPGITEPDLKDVAEELAKHIEQQRKEANG